MSFFLKNNKYEASAGRQGETSSGRCGKPIAARYDRTGAELGGGEQRTSKEETRKEAREDKKNEDKTRTRRTEHAGRKNVNRTRPRLTARRYLRAVAA
ncbi:unnamed protein product, partial [Amoebophrya sp. A25]|eukprot:GSA25T00015307001.1